jgi:signal transduction histidine kinase
VVLDKMASMSGLVDGTIQSVQRISAALRPSVLDDFGLLAAIEWQTEEFEKRTGIKCSLNLAAGDLRLDESRSTAVFRILQETLTNVARHAQATRVSISLKKEDGNLILRVRDNGRGITETEISSAGSLGILGIRERAHILGGTVLIAGVPGKGTTVTAAIPLSA